jgi:ribosome maturation factor RimP
MKQAIVEKVNDIAGRVTNSEGLELVEVELLGEGKGRLLRITIDKPGGVSHSDCELVSHHVGTILDVEDVIPGGSYRLEVSSPGVERRLKGARDFQRFLGKRARVVLREPVEEQRTWEGTLADLSEDVVTLEPQPGQVVRFRLEQVQRANLKFDW